MEKQAFTWKRKESISFKFHRSKDKHFKKSVFTNDRIHHQTRIIIVFKVQGLFWFQSKNYCWITNVQVQSVQSFPQLEFQNLVHDDFVGNRSRFIGILPQWNACKSDARSRQFLYESQSNSHRRNWIIKLEKSKKAILIPLPNQLCKQARILI